MTILLDVAVVGLGVLVGRWVVRRARARRAAEGEIPAPPTATDEEAPVRLDGFPCTIGNAVVRRLDHQEAWLAGALVFEEAALVAVLFIAPEMGGDRGLFMRRDAPDEIAWMSVADVSGAMVGAEPPHALEHAKRAYTRARRLPVRVRRVGAGAPSVGEQAILAEYEGADDARLVVVAGSAGVFAWAGERVRMAEVDVL